MRFDELYGRKATCGRLKGLGIFGVLVLILPIFMRNEYYLGVLFLCHYYVILACSWDLLTGYTGQVNFGHAFFIGGAGYAGALMNLHLGWQWWLTLPIGGLVAALFGLVVGAATLRLKGPYFAGVTFCFAVILYKVVMASVSTLGGEEGLFGVDGLMNTSMGNYYFSGILMLAVVIFLYILSRSSFGLILRSIGENEIASEGSGINTTFYKVTAFVISAFLAGVAGAMYCHVQMSVSPQQAGPDLSGLILMMAVVGGLGSITGPIIGAYLLTGLNESLRFIGELRMLIYSGTVVVVVLFAPKGLIDISGRLKDLALTRMGWKIKAPEAKVNMSD